MNVAIVGQLLLFLHIIYIFDVILFHSDGTKFNSDPSDERRRNSPVTEGTPKIIGLKFTT